MNKNYYIFFGVFILILFPLVSSAQITQVNVGDNGLQVYYPEFDFVKQNAEFSLHIHISNKSNGFPLTNDLVDCRIHLYNSSGDHTFQSGVLTKDVNNYDHEIFLNSGGGNFSDLGIHSFYIWCNDSSANLGGEAKGAFSVTLSGLEPVSGITQAMFLLLFLVIVGGMLGLLLYTIFKMIEWNFDAKDLIISVSVYFVVFVTYILSKTYLNNLFVDEFLMWLIGVGAFTTVILPIIAFFMTYMKGGLDGNEK
jgi:hypothetical protein